MDAEAAEFTAFLLDAVRCVGQPVLILEDQIQLLKIGCEGNGSLGPLEEGLASGRVRHFGEIALAVVYLENVPTESTDSRGIQGVDNNAGLLSSLDRTVN